MKKEQIFHLRQLETGNPSHKGGATICYIHDLEKNIFKIGVAVCSPHDNFNKRKGIKMAYSHAMKNGYFWNKLFTKEKVFEIAGKMIIEKINNCILTKENIINKNNKKLEEEIIMYDRMKDIV